jgi:very-short-patch-repair endonuclease
VTWWTVARAQAGAISWSQLGSAGVGPTSVTRMLSRGELERFCHRVYVAGGAPLTLRARLWASVLATDGVISFHSAGQLWGVLDEPGATIHLTLPHARRVARPPGCTLHRVPVPRSEQRLRSELPVTSRSWTVLDLVATLPPAAATQLADRAVQRRWMTQDDLARRLRLQPGRTGNNQLRRVGALISDGAAAESERVLHRLLRRAGLRGWRPNYEVWAAGELVAVVDVALPELRVAFEVDGMAFHVDADRFGRDRHRQNTLVALGWTVVRFTWADLTDRPGYVVALLTRFGSATARRRA